jgi:hypothetical protein
MIKSYYINERQVPLIANTVAAISAKRKICMHVVLIVTAERVSAHI